MSQFNVTSGIFFISCKKSSSSFDVSEVEMLKLFWGRLYIVYDIMRLKGLNGFSD